jgi:hypothetical protein
MAVVFGIAVFAVIVVIGWRSVQNRRIVRLQGADGHETIIVANEDDEISSVETSTEAAPTTVSAPAEAPEFGRGPAGPQTLV